jgi:transcriptional regulator with XRE-family HTH domain
MTERAGDWLKRHRIAAGFTKQDTLSRTLGLSRGAVGNWESGRGGPGPANVPALAAALGVPQTEVLAVFGIKMRGDLRTPAPPWAEELLTEVRAMRQALESQAPLLAGWQQIAEKVEELAAGQLLPSAEGSPAPGGGAARRRKGAGRAVASR